MFYLLSPTKKRFGSRHHYRWLYVSSVLVQRKTTSRFQCRFTVRCDCHASRFVVGMREPWYCWSNIRLFEQVISLFLTDISGMEIWHFSSSLTFVYRLFFFIKSGIRRVAAVAVVNTIRREWKKLIFPIFYTFPAPYLFSQNLKNWRLAN